MAFHWQTPWTQCVNWTYIRCSEYVQEVSWTSYVRIIFVHVHAEYNCLTSFLHYLYDECNNITVSRYYKDSHCDDDYEKEDDHYENEDEEDSKMKTRKNLIYVKFYFKRYVIA